MNYCKQYKYTFTILKELRKVHITSRVNLANLKNTNYLQYKLDKLSKVHRNNLQDQFSRSDKVHTNYFQNQFGNINFKQ
jgi:hypothetical protein